MRFERYRQLGILACISLVLTLLLVSCGTYIDLSAVDTHYRQGNFSRALYTLERRSDQMRAAQGPIILAYDLGILNHYSGNWEQSNQLLSESERLIEEAYTKSISQGFASYMINDAAKAYEASAYEELAINLIKALNYLALGESEGALVELRRAIEKQAHFSDRYARAQAQLAATAQADNLPYASSSVRTTFTTSALLHWLASIVSAHLADWSMTSYAQQAALEAFSLQPHLYPFTVPKDLHLGSPREGKARLHLLSFVGQSPEREELVEYLPFSNDLQARIAYPTLQMRPSAVAAIEVTTSDGVRLLLEPIESLERIALDTFGPTAALARQRSYLRTTARLLGKVAVTKEEEEQTLLSLLLDLVFTVSAEVAEQADLRSTHYLPAEAWIGSLDLNPGVYHLVVTYYDKRGAKLASEMLQPVTLSTDSLTLIELIFPR
ncbi:MAG TPA: hypothetical protein VFC80_02315 [Sphaerochaeta sp.]|nr:hypothetical protein [Sphaerochaeta sp.]